MAWCWVAAAWPQRCTFIATLTVADCESWRFLQEQTGDSTWVWSQVHDLSAQVSSLREQLAQSLLSVEDLKSKLAFAEAAGTPDTSTDTNEVQQQLHAEVCALREDLEAAERARDEHSARTSTLQTQLDELRTALANEQMRQEEGARAAAESHARERGLEEELAAVRGDLVETQRSLVAAAEAPEDLAGAMSDVAVRALSTLRQGVADVFSSNDTVGKAAASCNDEWLLGAVRAAVAGLQHSSSGGGTSDRKLAVLQQDLEIMNSQRLRAEKSALDAEVEIGQLCDKFDMATEAREQAEATCEELRSNLQLCRECVPHFCASMVVPDT